MNVRPTAMIDEMVTFLLDRFEIDAMENNRSESVVLSRAALFNVCRGYYSATTLGKHFGKNHATVLHHFRNHESLMIIPLYRNMYFELAEVMAKYDDRAKTTYVNAIDELDRLRAENKMLHKKLERCAEEVNS